MTLQPRERAAARKVELRLRRVERDRAVEGGKRFVVLGLLEERVAFLECFLGGAGGVVRALRDGEDQGEHKGEHFDLLPRLLTNSPEILRLSR